MSAQYYLYRHIRRDTGMPFYIGIGKRLFLSPGTFMKDYCRAFSSHGRSRYWKNVIALSGFDVEILFEASDRDEIIAKEKEFIALYGRKDTCGGMLVNMTDGGDGMSGCKHTEETKRKISKSHIGIIPSAETRLLLSVVKKGHVYRKGFKISEETKQKISTANKGRPSPFKKPPKEKKPRTSHFHGRRHTDEAKAKIGLASIGRKHNIGRTHTEATKLKISNTKRNSRIQKEAQQYVGQFTIL